MQSKTLAVIRRVAVLVLIGWLLAGCSSFGVQPWQRDLLSQPEMTFGATDLNQTFSGHFYFAREATGGGGGFVAGGCGCN